MTKPVIGFIGLGLMGGNMVENLQTSRVRNGRDGPQTRRA